MDYVDCRFLCVAEASQNTVTIATLGLIDQFQRRDKTVMVFTKADALALASDQFELYARLLASTGKLCS